MNPRALHILRVWETRVWILLLYAIPLHEASKNILWALACAMGAVRLVCERRGAAGGVAGAAILLWIASGIWASLFAIEPAASWKGVWDMARSGAMYWLALGIADSPARRLAVVRHVVFATFLASLAGLGGFAWSFLALKTELPRLALQLPSVGHYNQSACFLAMAWMLALAAALQGRILGPWPLALAACAVISVALAGTTSRSALVTAMACTLITLGQVRFPSWRKGLLLASIPLIVLCMAGAPGLRERLLTRGSFHSRVSIWRPAVDMALSRPWSGVGVNNFKNILLESDQPQRLTTVDHAHNLAINTLVQAGFPGLASLGFMLAAFAANIWSLRRGFDGEGRLLFRAALGVWLTIILIGSSNTPLHHEISMLFFLVMGLAAGESSTISTRPRMAAKKPSP